VCVCVCVCVCVWWECVISLFLPQLSCSTSLCPSPWCSSPSPLNSRETIWSCFLSKELLPRQGFCAPMFLQPGYWKVEKKSIEHKRIRPRAVSFQGPINLSWWLYRDIIFSKVRLVLKDNYSFTNWAAWLQLIKIYNLIWPPEIIHLRNENPKQIITNNYLKNATRFMNCDEA